MPPPVKDTVADWRRMLERAFGLKRDQQPGELAKHHKEASIARFHAILQQAINQLEAKLKPCNAQKHFIHFPLATAPVRIVEALIRAMYTERIGIMQEGGTWHPPQDFLSYLELYELAEHLGFEGIQRLVVQSATEHKHTLIPNIRLAYRIGVFIGGKALNMQPFGMKDLWDELNRSSTQGQEVESQDTFDGSDELVPKPLTGQGHWVIDLICARWDAPDGQQFYEVVRRGSGERKVVTRTFLQDNACNWDRRDFSRHDHDELRQRLNRTG